MLIQKAVTILRKHCPNNVSRLILLRKLYDWFQLVFFSIIFTFALQRLRRRKLGGGGRGRKAGQNED